MDIGITTPGGSRVSTTRIIYGKISIPSAGVVESIHPYTDSNNANQTYDAAIYADNGSGTGPGALIGSTGELSDVTINFDSPQFLEIPAQTPIAIPAAGTYWWAFVADNSSNVGMYHVAGAASNVRSSANNGWTSKWPDPPDVSGPTLSSDLVGFVRFSAGGDIAGSGDVTLDDAALDASSEVETTGSLEQTLDSLAAEGSGGVSIEGSGDAQLGETESASQGSVDIEGSGEATLEDATLDASGASDANTGMLEQTLDGLSAEGAGEMAIDGSSSADLGELASDGEGSVDITGSLDATLDDLQSSAPPTELPAMSQIEFGRLQQRSISFALTFRG